MRDLPEEIRRSLALVAPGTGLRDAIENVIRAHNGALIVIANPRKLEEMSVITGGMRIDCSFTPKRLYELSKMDGALVVSPDIGTIHYANVLLTPDPTLPSEETGTRHLAAHRTARQTGDLVIAVSERRRVVSLYRGPYGPHVLEEIAVILPKANSALTTLERFTGRIADESRQLTLHEYDGTVTLREVVGLIGTFEYAVRIAAEIENQVRELGSEGHFVQMRLEQAFHDVPEQYEALLRDYVADGVDHEAVREALGDLTSEELSDAVEITQLLGYGSVGPSEDFLLKARGYRQLERVPRLPNRVAERLIEEFGSLKELLSATEEDLDEIEGIGQARARAIRRSLRRQRSLEGSGEAV
jgi:diadenylate cyclase